MDNIGARLLVHQDACSIQSKMEPGYGNALTALVQAVISDGVCLTIALLRPNRTCRVLVKKV